MFYFLEKEDKRVPQGRKDCKEKLRRIGTSPGAIYSSDDIMMSAYASIP